MRSMQHMTNTELFFEKPNAQVLGPFKATFNDGTAIIFDRSLNVDLGDILYQILPNGNKENYIITDVSFTKGAGSFPDFWRISSSKKDSTQSEESASNTTIYNYNISNSNSFQAGNHNSLNIQNILLELQSRIESSNASESDKAEAKNLIKKLLAHPLVSSIVGGVAGGLSGGVL